MKVYSTLSARKEDFVPYGDSGDGSVKMYVCGVTPYADAHFGHALSYTVFDVVRRYLKWRGYKVTYVQNVTDIEDKIIARANSLGIAPQQLARQYTDNYYADMAALNIGRPDITPLATEEIPKMIEVIAGLIAKGYAYSAAGDVYFRVTNMPDYGKLSHRTLDMMMAGARIEPGAGKEHPMDFVLWKAAKPGEPSWDSPWGRGRPGWHIECTAMSMRYLGEQIDIHGGGADLIFPHHENEIAQSECFSGKKPFVKYWMHNGLLQLGAEKMSKSLGNLVTIREALAKYSADGIRIFILSSHYRNPLTYSEEALEGAERGAERLRQVATLAASNSKPADIDAAGYRQRFVEAMDDDFNTPQALSALFDLVREINRARDAGEGVGDAQQEFLELAGVLGLQLKAPEGPAAEVGPFIELLIKTRSNLRTARQFELADGIRKQLLELGIVLEDGPQGTTWKRKR